MRIMKNRKRNITMAAVLLFVCTAVALNWSYNKRWGSPDAEMAAAEDAEMMLADPARCRPAARTISPKRA